jgi:hypothetical protein
LGRSVERLFFSNSGGIVSGTDRKAGSRNGHGTAKPIAIYYEHPDWFRPLFQELDRRGVAWVRIDATRHQYDVAERASEYALLFNRMSPSAWLRGNGHAIFYTLNYLAHFENIGVRVVNGLRAFTMETSKALQLDLLESLGLPYPKARIINHPSQAAMAAEHIGYPLVIKPNIGGSGAGIQRFDHSGELQRALEEGTIQLGIDQVGLVQEFVPARERTITRVEILGGKYLYAIRIHLSGESYNLCPADICQNTKGEELLRSACPVNAPKSGLTVEAYTPPQEVVEAVERIMKTAGIEVGGVEYIVDERDGRLLYYDINALSNFVADAPRVLGFDPFARLADFLIAEASYEPLADSVAAGAV